MEISLNGDSAFLVKSTAGSVICDPRTEDEAQYVATSAADDTQITAILYSSSDPGDHAPHRVGGPPALTRPGEYEVGELGVRGIALLASDDPADRRVTTAYRINAERLEVLMLGDPGGLPDGDTQKRIGHVDALLIDTTRTRLSPAQLSSLVTALEPSMVLVNGIDRETGEPSAELAAIAKDIGGSDQQSDPVLRQNISKSALSEGRKLVVLRPR